MPGSDGRIARALLWTLIAAHLVLVYPPWRYAPIAPGLDAAWIDVITHAAAHGWQWGRDIIFTYGPLGYAWHTVFEKSLFAQVLVLNAMFVGALALGVIGVLKRLPTASAFALYLPLVFAISLFGKGVYLTIPVLAAMMYFTGDQRESLVPVVTMAAIAGVFATVFIPAGVIAALVFLLMDASRLLHRATPLFLPAMLGAALFSYLVAGQSAAWLPEYLRASWELGVGYAAAMGSEANAIELAAFVGAACVTGWVIVESELRDAPIVDRADRFLFLGCVFAFGFVMWKSGFVRYEGHSFMAWLSLAIVACAYVAIRGARFTGRARPIILLGIATAACLLGVARVHGGNDPMLVAKQLRYTFYGLPLSTLREMTTIAAAPDAWWAELHARRARAEAAERRALPLPAFDGTVDIVADRQSAVLAHGLTYRSRPVFQAYAAYTPWLLARNRDQLRADGADHLLFGNTVVDNRYPLSSEGRSLVAMLSGYRAVAAYENLLELRKRVAPSPVDEIRQRTLRLSLGAWTEVESTDSVVILAGVVKTNFWGKLLAVAWRPVLLSITVRLADGTEHEHRLVAAAASDGMLLSPYVDTPFAYLALATGTLEALASKRVVALKLDTQDGRGRFLYDNEIPLKLVDLAIVPSADGDLPAELDRTLARMLVANRLSRTHANAGEQPTQAIDTMLFAHAPARAALAVSFVRKLQVTYGISGNAWQKDAGTDGVCFRILAQGGAWRELLHEHCLRPGSREEDRLPQRVDIQVRRQDAESLIFETDCAGSCAWDWSYWKDVDVLH